MCEKKDQPRTHTEGCHDGRGGGAYGGYTSCPAPPTSQRMDLEFYPPTCSMLDVGKKGYACTERKRDYSLSGQIFSEEFSIHTAWKGLVIEHG